MRKTYTCATLFPLAPIAAWVALACSEQANAAEWAITPGADIVETYTDNLKLTQPGTERGDFITEISPRLSVKGSGARMNLNAEYLMRNFFYARDKSSSNTHHILQANADAELVEDLFFIDGKASSDQQVISPFGPQSSGNGNITGNEADVRSYSVSPYLRHHFGNSAIAEVRYTRDAVTADSGGLLDSHSNQLHMDLNSGADFRTLQWSALFDDQRIDYVGADNVETKSLSGTLRYLMSQRFALSATSGYEDDSYVTIGEKPKGAFWSVGATWTPSERSSVAISTGRRFFGRTLSLSAQHATRMAVWSLGYQEDITTVRSQFLVPPTQNTEFIHDTGLPASVTVPVNSFTNRVFLQKSAYASAAFRSAKNNLLVSLFYVEREPQSAPDTDRSLADAGGNLLAEATRQSGVSSEWSLRLSPRTNFTAGAGYSRVWSESTSRQDNDVTARIGLSHQFQQKVKGGIQLRRIENRSNQSGGDFRENAISAFLQLLL